MNCEPLALVILAGGSGTRFWPQSRRDLPKQFLPLLGERTLLQQTAERSGALVVEDRVFVVLGERYADIARRQLPHAQLLVEPCGRDTAPAVALAALSIRKNFGPAAVFGVLPADHAIGPDHEWRRAVQAAAQLAAEAGVVVTMGITPSFAATGYGYIRAAESLGATQGLASFRADRFLEKPDAASARGFVESGGHFWNAGIFFHRADTILDELGRQAPDILETLAPVEDALGTPAQDAALAAHFPRARKISIDYAVMQGARRMIMLRPEFRWDDLGAWDALMRHHEADETGTVTCGKVIAHAARGCLLWSTGDHLLAAAHIEGLACIHTEDATLIVPLERAQAVKDLIDRVGKQAPEAL